jgi:hypothetical protein
MSRDVEVHDTSAIVCEDDKNEEDFEPNSVDGEEVDGRELRNVIIEECSPCLRWGLRTSNHVFGDGGLRNLDVQLHEFTVNPGSAPRRVFTAHGSNQIASFFRNSRTSGPTVADLPGPIPSKSLPMPADNGFRLHDQ